MKIPLCTGTGTRSDTLSEKEPTPSASATQRMVIIVLKNLLKF